MSIPQDLMMQAQEIGAGMDQAQEQGMQIASPQGQFSARALNALTKEVNTVLTMLGEQTPIPDFTEDQTTFAPEFMQAVMAIMQIASDAQLPIDMMLSELTSDQDIARLAAMIKRLSDSKEFKDYLSQVAEPAEMETETEITEEVMPEGEAPMMTDEELFASRVR
jgi:hypothetical protein